jgi:hypothetical protein
VPVRAASVRAVEVLGHEHGHEALDLGVPACSVPCGETGSGCERERLRWTWVDGYTDVGLGSVGARVHAAWCSRAGGHTGAAASGRQSTSCEVLSS